MYARTVEIQNESGLHARPGSKFVVKAQTFKADVFIRKLDDPARPNKVNAKAMIQVLTLGLPKGQAVELSAIGEDEVEAVDALVALIEELED